MTFIGMLLLANIILTIHSSVQRVRNQRYRQAAQAAGYGVLR